jgi:hypothetical protein
MAYAARDAFPGDAVRRDTERDHGPRADRLDVRWKRASAAQHDPADAAAERQPEALVDEHRAGVAAMLDRVQCAVPQNGNCKPGIVGDAVQAEIAFTGRAPRAELGWNHGTFDL